MAKIIKNTTGSPIFLSEVGFSVDAGENYSIQLEHYLRWAKPEAITEITPFINSGDIVVNDGNIDLSASAGIRFLEYADRAIISKDDVNITTVNKVINFEGSSFNVVDNGDGKTTVSSTLTAEGSLVRFDFESIGNTANKWLGYSNSAKSSQTIPLIVAGDTSLRGLTFSNADNNVDVDVQIYKNGSLVFTWLVRNKRTAFKIGISPAVSFLQGDRISVFLKKFTGGTGDQTPQDPTIGVLNKVVQEQIAEGGTQFGV
jgi:predicted SpoU family rRNA methylase